MLTAGVHALRVDPDCLLFDASDIVGDVYRAMTAFQASEPTNLKVDGIEKPPWENFGPEMNNLLNRIGVHCSKNKLTAKDAERIFDAGLFARAALLTGNQSADTSECPEDQHVPVRTPAAIPSR